LTLRRTRRLIAVAALVVIAAAVGLFLTIVVTSESGNFSNGGVGVTRVGDSIVIESCAGPIGKVDVSRGTDSGNIVWSATSIGGGVDAVPAVGAVAGYHVSGEPIDPTSTNVFAIQTVHDVRGSPFTSVILPFVPAHLVSGRIALASGSEVDLAPWRASGKCK
jgi:hypothetical protein